MIKKNVVNQKLITMKQYLSELGILARHSLDEYLRFMFFREYCHAKKQVSDFTIKRSTERLIQVIVECTVDCNNLILVGLGDSPPVDYKESFTKLVAHAVIPMDFASRLIPYVSIRNRIVHEYNQLQDDLVYAIINMFTSFTDGFALRFLQDMKRYQRLIINYLKTV